MDSGTWQATVHGVTESGTTEATSTYHHLHKYYLLSEAFPPVSHPPVLTISFIKKK